LSWNPKSYEVGKVADRTIIAERNFDFVDKKSTSIRDYNLQRNITPVFKVYNNITEETLAEFDLFIQRVREYNSKKTRMENIETAFSDFLHKYNNLDIETIKWLFEKPSIFSILDVSRAILLSAMNEGIIIETENTQGYHQDELFERWQLIDGQRIKDNMLFSDALTKEKIKDYAKTTTAKTFDKDLPLIANIVSAFSTENCFYDFEETQKKREEVLASVSPVYKTIKKGSVIVEKDFIITDSDMEILKAIDSISTKSNYKKQISVIFYLFMIYIFAIIFFSFPKIINYNDKKEVILLVIMSEIFFLIAFLILKFTVLPHPFNFALFIPISVFTMIISIIISQFAGIYFSIICGFILLGLCNFSAFPAIFLIMNGILGVILVKKADTRIDLIIAGIRISLCSIFLIVILLLFTNADIKTIIISVIISLVNGLFSGILTLGLLPIVEYALNAPTKFRLIELSDLNNPILKKMHNLAPGTFHHSLNVANLAEDACREIGANALLARVGSYYHDIGKIEQASYFVENQKSYNKHNYMKASLSVSIIKSHVKTGIEKAKELRLPQSVIDIIAQHHGNGLISYFYRKAIKETKNKSKIIPYDYFYTEETPKSKEAATVLLADNVEAAVRTLKKPTITRLDKYVWSIIMSKIDDRQITESDLTFNELEVIKNSFIKTLSGTFHARIEYPDVKKVENETKTDDPDHIPGNIPKNKPAQKGNRKKKPNSPKNPKNNDTIKQPKTK
jgi:putative nucleotidyltransferase with HDIG domain